MAMGAILYCCALVRSKRPVGREVAFTQRLFEKSSKPVQNRSKIRVVRKCEPEIGPVRKRTVPFPYENSRSSSGPLSGPVGFLRVHTNAFHLLSWLLSPSILEKLSFTAGVLLFRNKLLNFSFSEPQNSF